METHLLAYCDTSGMHGKRILKTRETILTLTRQSFRYKEFQIKEKEISYSHKGDKTLTLYYNGIACPCPQWSEIKFNENPKERLYYLERASEKLVNTDTLFDGEHLPVQIQVIGQVVSENGYPKGFNSAKGAEKGKVFRYTKIKVFKN
jgi:hypothetical protein